MNQAASSPSGAEASRADRIRVFVVDDSSVVRMVFSRLIASEPALELAGTAATAEEALGRIGALDLHVILLDLEMPGMGGMRALPAIIRRAGKAKVMVVSTHTAAGAAQTIEALSRGAADTLRKPDAGGFDQAYKDRLVEKIRALAYRPLVRRAAAPGEAATAALPLAPAPVSFGARIVAIGASTGGIQATAAVLTLLPPRVGVPIAITQHLPPDFSAAYARQLAEATGRTVEIARDGTALLPDRIVLAPGDAHLAVAQRDGTLVARLDRQKALSGCMPSVDTLFASLAQSCRAHALGVCLTGMGRDGVIGARHMVEAGSSVIVQDEASSVVWGMPGAIARAGLAAAVLHPADIALRIVQAARPA